VIKTLIVEDNRDFRASLKAVLYARFPDMLIAEAEDGNEALRAFALFHPDVAFVDVSLPGDINGLTLVERFRSKNDRVRIVIITNHDLPEYREASVRLGANHFLPKVRATRAEIFAVMESVTASRGGIPGR
jgi:two-component system response regulator YesN